MCNIRDLPDDTRTQVVDGAEIFRTNMLKIMIGKFVVVVKIHPSKFCANMILVIYYCV